MASTAQDFTPGLVLTDAMMDKLPQGILTVASVTASVGPTSSTTELTVLTAAAVTPAQTGRRFRLRFHCRAFLATVATDVYVVKIKEGATVLNDETHTPTSSTVPTAAGGTDFEAIVDNPSVAAHTYSVIIARSSGTGTLTMSATATAPAFLYVEDAGAA